MNPKRYPIHVIWIDTGTWSAQCSGTKHEIMKFTALGLKLSEIRTKVEQFLEDTQYDGRQVMIMTGPDDEGKCHPIPC